MKVSSFSTIILLPLAISSMLLFIPQTQATLTTPSLVESICRKTPYYHLCVATLKSQLAVAPPEVSAAVEIAGYARIMLKLVAAKIPVIIEEMEKIYNQTDKAAMQKAMDTCVASYAKMGKEVLPQAMNGLDKGQYTVVIHAALTAGNLAASCDKECIPVVTSAAGFGSGSGSGKGFHSGFGKGFSSGFGSGSAPAPGSASSSGAAKGSGSGSAAASLSVLRENNQYVQNMSAITVSIVSRLAQTKQQKLA